VRVLEYYLLDVVVLVFVELIMKHGDYVYGV